MSELKNLIFKISWQKIRSGFYRLIKLRFCMALPKMLVILIKQIHSILFFFLLSFKIIASNIYKHVVLVIYCCSTNALNQILFNSIQNSQVHESRKLVENLQHMRITTEQSLTLNRCPKKPRIQCFEIYCRNVLLTQHRSVSSVCFLGFSQFLGLSRVHI